MIQLDYPKEKDWREIWYQPQPFVVTLEHYGSDKYWLERGYTIRVLSKEDHGMFNGLVRGVTVELTPPEGKEMYVEPLATIHKAFWEKMAEVQWDMYDGSRKPDFAKRQALHEAVIHIYWELLDYKDYTPDSFVGQLNTFLRILQENCLKNDSRQNPLDKQKERLEGFIRESVS